MRAIGNLPCQTARTHRFHWLLMPVLSYSVFASPAGATENPPSVTFAVLGHIYPGVERPEILRAAVEQINALNVDAVFLLGDLVRSGTQHEWDGLLHLLAGLNAPWYAVPGNHDLASDDGLRNWTANVSAQLHRAVEVNGFQFLLLDSNGQSGPKSTSPGLDESHRAFLKEKLSRSDAYHGSFVMLHHVLWLPESELTNRRYPATHWRKRIAPLLHNRADAVFAGDVESYFRTNDADLELYAIGWPLTGRWVDDRLEPHEHIYLRKPFILLARCDANGLHVEPIAVRCDIQSELFDTSRWKRNNSSQWSAVGLKLWVRNHLQTAMLTVAAAFFIVGAAAATLFRKRRLAKTEESAR